MERGELLMGLAVVAAKRAYCPYSKFRVGAALLARDGTLYYMPLPGEDLRRAARVEYFGKGATRNASSRSAR